MARGCPAATARNEILKATPGLGRIRRTYADGSSSWKRWSGYHARSRMEAKRRRQKAFGERIASRDPDRQTAGPLKSRSASGCRLTRTNGVNLLLMTRFKALSTAETERMA